MGTIRDMSRSLQKLVRKPETEKFVRVYCWFTIASMTAEAFTEIKEYWYGILNFHMSIKLLFFSISYGYR
ncbi:hypothetical protein RHGRI_036106 [Rhododendron griersonianum]|uniref:Uncharacterized protein n=1 Tax=Rhododendron griersonianum TaxID=479676 RepID=A0AAV6HSG4_9ERIC|nr:hypothetical protein RHGRI_036106 [Rhododendron griersonianum]